MWLYVKTGFYSIVHKPPCGENELMVRVRCQDDMDKLRKRLTAEYEFNGEVIDSPKADYAYRMIVPGKSWRLFWPMKPWSWITTTSRAPSATGITGDATPTCVAGKQCMNGRGI